MSQLNRLLKEADALAGNAPRLGLDRFIGARGEIARRGRRNKLARIGTVTALIVGAVFSVVRWQDTSHEKITRNAVVANDDGIVAARVGTGDLERELTRLREEIRAREEHVALLLAHEQIRRADRVEAALAIAGVPPRENAVERAAAAVVTQGNRLRDVGDGTQAEQSYGSVLEHFPGTVAADVARKKLNQIRKVG